MGLTQLNFEGKNKIEVAIMRLKNFEPPEGYYGAFSGGKDSITIYYLTKLASVKVDWHYNLTNIDPPQLVQFIKTFPDVTMEHPPLSFHQLLEKKGLPRRNARWCCEALKERGGSGRIVLTGIRWEESAKRRQRRMVETCYTDRSKRFVHPIIDWETTDVWEFITQYELSYCQLYDEGFKRLGCVLCPMTRDIERQLHYFPKTVEAIKRSARRYWERQTKGGQRFASFKDFWGWWLDRDALSINQETPQAMMFDNEVESDIES